MQAVKLTSGKPQTQFAVKDGVLYYVEPENHEKTLVSIKVDACNFAKRMKFNTKYNFGLGFQPSGYDSLTVVNNKLVYVPESDSDTAVLELEVHPLKLSVKNIMNSFSGDFISPTVCYNPSTRTMISLDKQRIYKDCTTLDIGAYITGFTHNNRFHFFRPVKDIPYIWSFDLDNEENAHKQRINDSDDAQYLMQYPGRTMSLIFEDAVIVVLYRMRQFFKYDINKRTVVEITDLIDFDSHYAFDFRYITQDTSNIYICGKFWRDSKGRSGEGALSQLSSTQLWRIPVPPREETPTQEACSSSAGDVSQHNKCPVCWEPFVTPKIFGNCGHSVCHKCARKLAADRFNARCPICRVDADILFLGRDSLPTNYSLKEVLDAQRAAQSSTSECPPVHTIASSALPIQVNRGYVETV
ncbi:hypothetical protein QR680_004338 [Steinernema hermaphroditum]|uniref:RING-type domain-containing protein n=1 Tax=Steinernema hermaphroditum TaxID=289476 RepID=A0AA39LTU2_9BILA|nr:hypothetical protein QR680_004338 [Steinernema hermaphroditum]